MRIAYCLLLTTSVMATSVYAESQKLPPVLDNSVYTDTVPAAKSLPSLPNPENAVDLQEFKAEITTLNNKIREQEKTISDLKQANEDLRKKMADMSKEAAKGDKTGQKKYVLPNVPALDDDATVSTNSEKERYQRAIALLKKNDYDHSVSEMQSLIKAYPNGKYADNAQYWIGVALMNKDDKKGAIQAFDRLARNYPNSDKIPEGLYKLGAVLVSVKNTAKAREYFDYVIEKYPGTEGANLAAKALSKLN